jgi:lipopolysaccharide assembly protein A
MVLLILTLLLALFIAIFAVQNAAPVAIKLLWTVTEVPLVLVILGSVLAGAIIVFLIATWREFRLKRKTLFKPEVKLGLETEVKELKNSE